MIRSAVTVSLVPESRGGPFIFWDDLPAACRKASALGFDAIEIFAPDADAVDPSELRKLLNDHGLKAAAFGTGGVTLRHKINLTLADATLRRRAKNFVRGIIDLAGQFGAPAIVGSIQGRSGDAPRETALGWLAESLQELAEDARIYNVPLLFEPLNRYETNLCTSLESALALLDKLSTKNIKLLADLFHWSIEEADIAASIKTGGQRIGHIHFVDSNRRAAGMGHIDFPPIVTALKNMHFDGYLSAEALSYPDPDAAANQTIQSYRRLFI